MVVITILLQNSLYLEVMTGEFPVKDYDLNNSHPDEDW